MNTKQNKKHIKKILIANRSEIALRIQYTCRAIEIETVAIYTEDDRSSGYVRNANEAFALSAKGSSAFLAQDEIINIAIQSGADAIHPGYGFLSENALFARKVEEAGLVWIGPKFQNIMKMGNNIKARKLMAAANVPVIPGRFLAVDAIDSVSQAHTIAQSIGFPVIIKDPKAGGGKAMRTVYYSESLGAALEGVTSEAARLTGSKELLIEKYIQHGRHIEIQVAGDGHNAVHFYERECSIQRRHQKIIEETPCNFISQTTIEKMYEAAQHAVCFVQYENIGTIEFIVTPDEQFYFLEMNTRLQVEHAITELVTGIDLVALQIEIAQTGELPLRQADIHRHGHAIECRIYAENPENNFLPSTGTISHLELPNGPFMRIDHDLEEGKEITPFFDPMIAKIATIAPTRKQATAFMQEVLRQFVVCGIETNINFLANLIDCAEFHHGSFHTQYLSDEKIRSIVAFHKNQDSTSQHEEKIVAAALLHLIDESGVFIPESNKKSGRKNPPVNTFWKTQQWK